MLVIDPTALLIVSIVLFMPRREHDTCSETPEAKEETQEQKKKEDYHPKKRRKMHTQVWGTALYYMKGC